MAKRVAGTRRARVRAGGPSGGLEAPGTPDGLHAWLRDVLGVEVPRSPMVEGHAAPFDYLVHAFFGPGEGPADCVVWANRGGGKTFLGAVATALDLLFRPGIEVRVLAGSLEQAARMHAHLRAIFARDALARLVLGRVTDRRLRLRNGSGVELLAQSQVSVRGTRVQRLRCDEVELFDPEVWEAAQLTTRSKVCGGVPVRASIECLSTMHVPHGMMARLVEEARRGRRRLLRWGLVDVLERCGDEHRCRGGEGGDCALWKECAGRAKLDRHPDGSPRISGHVGVDDALRMKGRVSPATWAAEMLCLRPRRTDSVLPEFDPAVHVVKELPWDREGGVAPAATCCGIDFGFRSPTVVLWACVDASGAAWVVDERVERGTILGVHVRAITDRPGPRPAWVGVDPAGRAANDQTGVSAVEVLRRAGLAVRSRRLPMHEGLELVRARLRPADGARPRLFVHARCTALIESLEKYHYDARRPESLDPVKDGHDHAADALRYLVQNLDRPHRTRRASYLGS